MNFFKTPLAMLFASATLFASGVARSGAAQTATAAQWALISVAPVDPRLTAEIDQLATAQKATVTTFKMRALAERIHPALTIELVSARNPRAFERALAHGSHPAALTPETAPQGYLMLATGSAGGQADAALRSVRIEAETPDGFHNGVIRLAGLLRLWPGDASTLVPEPQHVEVARKDRSERISIADFPAFSARGVVEGFYGAPWSHQDRLDILRFEGDHGMNVYYYAPKDDPYHRERWRDPYPPDRSAQLGELVRAARANFVDFCFAVSPGLSMTYSSDADFDTLASKLTSVGRLGTSCYALFLDDVPEELQQPADQSRFKDLAAAHAYVVNKLYHYLAAQSPANHLVVTPTTYTNGFGSRDYVRELGGAVDPHVDLMWTGTEVVSPVITVAQARDWSKDLLRPPLVWDNYPVDDYRRWRPFLGPLVGRASDLETAVRGLVSNPMNEAHASMLPLWTIADYLWNPVAYKAAQAEQRALKELYGTQGPSAFAPLLANYGDYGWQENVFTPLYAPSRLPIDIGEMNRHLAAMQPAFEVMKGRPEFAEVLPELEPFVEKAKQRAQALAADPAFAHLSDGKIQWDEDYATLVARRLTAPPALNGDFAKWASGTTYALALQPPRPGAAPASPPAVPFSGRFALGWDGQYLYVGVDIHDTELYQPAPAASGPAPGIMQGDAVALAFETAYHQDYYATSMGADAVLLLASPGNFNGVAPALAIPRANLAPRFQNYKDQVKTAWHKTSQGYSGDIAIPASFFTGGAFGEGYEIGLLVSAQKLVPPGLQANESPERIRLTSQADPLLPANAGNPSTYQRVVLAGQP
jgi:beta-N-acetylglucosaminidase